MPLMIRKWGVEECCEELLGADSNLWGADLEGARGWEQRGAAEKG